MNIEHDIARIKAIQPDWEDGAFTNWLNTPHEMLKNKSPLYWIEQGKVDQVVEFVLDGLSGQST